MERLTIDDDFRDWLVLNLPLQVLMDMYEMYKGKTQVSIVIFPYGESIDERAALAEMGPITEEEIAAFKKYLFRRKDLF